MQFDGIDYKGHQLRIRRPKDYQPPGYNEYGTCFVSPPLRPYGLANVYSLGRLDVDMSANAVPDTPNKIFVGGLPSYLTEDQVVELLKSFGELRAFNLVKDPSTGQSKVDA